jgi:hypothetical protein
MNLKPSVQDVIKGYFSAMGKMGGKTKTQAKKASSARNLAKARAKRWLKSKTP